MSAGLKRCHRTLAEMLAELGGGDPERTFRQGWIQKLFTVRGRRDSPTASIEEIPAAAAPYATLAAGRGMLIVRTGHGQRAPELTGPQLHTEASLSDQIFGPAERWYDVQVSLGPASSTMKSPRGRPEHYDWPALAKPLEKYVKSEGCFASKVDLVNWCIDHVKLKKGKRAPKGAAAGGPDPKAAAAAIARHGLDAIGLAPPA